jgi:hypothetical protein
MSTNINIHNSYIILEIISVGFIKSGWATPTNAVALGINGQGIGLGLIRRA